METVFPEVKSNNPPSVAQNLVSFSSLPTTVPILSNPATTTTSIKPYELWLSVIFDPIVDIPSMISALNVNFANCGKIASGQCVMVFGDAADLMEIKRRIKMVFERMKQLEGFERDLVFNVGTDCADEDHSLLLK